jgi:exodeoxyribonuclease V alpha subunit
VQYSGPELWELELAWATTVHKAQGSEARAVVLALAPSHRPLLTRRLLYTGARAVRSMPAVDARAARARAAVVRL